MSELLIIGLSLAGLVLFGALGYFLGSKVANTKIAEAELKAKNIIADAEKEANNVQKEKSFEIKEEWRKKKQEFDSETQSKRSKLQVQENEIKAREDGIEKKLQTLMNKEKNLHNFEQDLGKKEKEIQALEEKSKTMHEEHVKKLEQIASLSRDEAKKQLMREMENDARKDASQILTKIREEAKDKAAKEAQSIIVSAIQRTASDHSMENTVSVVNLDSDDMKGRIIGKEGRNIRAFEAATGIDLIIDDTPEAVIISGFDPFRREVAKHALLQLMLDGRIHPTRIEEVVEKIRKELEGELVKIGENALMELDLHNMKPELMEYVGRMKYRTSYGQNLLKHSIEVSYLAGIMAGQLGLDVKLAKRAALLHDIGKVAEKELEGPHALVGMELARKYKEHPIILNAIGAHHEDIEMEHAISVIVQAADSISGARPGARRESLENYIKRLEKLEEIANSWDGVEKTFAIQAGRDLRVIVEPTKVNDQLADEMAMKIAQKIEEEMEYPGQIKVTVIRERRSFGLAK